MIKRMNNKRILRLFKLRSTNIITRQKLFFTRVRHCKTTMHTTNFKAQRHNRSFPSLVISYNKVSNTLSLKAQAVRM